MIAFPSTVCGLLCLGVVLRVMGEVPTSEIGSCCTATDTATILSKPGPSLLEFQPTATLDTEMELGLSLARHLSPSSATSLDWSLIWKNFYLGNGGLTPIPLDPSSVEPSKQIAECRTTFPVWIQYVATCKDTNLIYVTSEIVNTENITSLCPTATTCVKSPCNAEDRWVLIATHTNKKLNLEPKAMDKSGIENIDHKLTPCFKFKPPTDPDDFLNALLYREFTTKLNPSPSTGVNWAQYFQNVTEGIRGEGYVVRGADVPPGTFMNVYSPQGTCGSYSTQIRVFKLVLFTVDNNSGNCDLAKKENVPLEGC